MKLFIGTSGYAYTEWKGSFYPEKWPAKDMLRFYAERFGAVEINNSFYRMPKAEVLEAWAKQVPAGFRFVLKAPQSITHFRRLKGAEAQLAQFVEIASVLGKRLGPLLFQTHPNMKKDAGRLADFLALLPKGQRVAFEFRHPTWFDDEVFGVLKKRKVALCIAEANDGVEVPFVATADWGYVRMRMVKYTPAALKGWVQRVKGQAWREAYVFFKHEDKATGPKLAEKYMELAG